jgi:hypothetical protein
MPATKKRSEALASAGSAIRPPRSPNIAPMVGNAFTRSARTAHRANLKPEELKVIEVFEKKANDIADIKERHERQAVRP